MGLETMDSYRAAKGTYRGFDAKAATERQPALSWGDASEDGTNVFAVRVVTARPNVARLVSISNSGNAYCLERSTDGLTYGRVVDDGTRSTDELVASAAAVCGSTPWRISALRPPPWQTMCDTVEDSSCLICRMVQVIQKQTLEDPKPSFAKG